MNKSFSQKNGHIQLSISGMNCGGCVSSVEKALGAVEGVDEVLVSLSDRSALISGTAKEDVLIEALAAKGYDAITLNSSKLLELEEQAQRDYYRLVWQTAIAAIWGVTLMVSDMVLGLLPSIDDAQNLWLAICCITLGVMLYCGRHFYKSALKMARHRAANMNTLIALGTGAAWLYSAVIVINRDFFPVGVNHVYFETAVMIIAFVNLGHAVEMRARGNTSKAIKNLMNLKPKTARLIIDGEERNVLVETLRRDDVIRVVSGESIAADGVILEGAGYVNESLISGESLPISKSEGDLVIGGSVNENGVFSIKVTELGINSVLGQIISMVQRAQSSKPRIAKMVDRIASVFVPIVVVISAITFALWMWIGPAPSVNYAFASMLAVLVIACPCALGLATPISIVAGVGRAAEEGILIKNGDAVEFCAKVDTVLLDKTGTITEGLPALNKIITNEDEQKVLQLASSLEHGSNHPLAKAINNAADERNILQKPVSQFEEIIGSGVHADIEGSRYYLGSVDYISRLLNANQVNPELVETMKETAIEHEKLGESVIALADKSLVLALFTISDGLKKGAYEDIAALKRQGIKVVMLTGDGENVAQVIGGKVGIDDIRYSLSPSDKLAIVKDFQAQGAFVMMVGDGINDAPALSQANVGVAIGAGTEVAIAASDITITGEGVGLIRRAIELSKRTVSNIKQNLFGAFIYNIIGIPIAAGVLYPIFGILLSPMIAAAAMAMSSVTVVANAARLAKKR